MKQRGMTLLEVLVALVVFALAGLAILRTTAQQASTLGRLEEKTFAVWIAENQLTALRLEKQWPSTSWTDGSVMFAESTWYWRYRGIDSGNDSVRAVEVEVRHGSNDATPAAILRSDIPQAGEDDGDAN
ncbi:type II secretion system protein GspI [Lonsdalea britannica]|uniref:type II secretion system minor pseudopilin GspI n=1 Tax=Lonsdalea britannica TaxID=1082704 RepID=UPI000A1EA84A|nr:type II secretion system minor pseudopilin GspI [Lonsdalea britannica]OSN05883.1 type II secretion system protein GspI [Lonsdalea britannica]